MRAVAGVMRRAVRAEWAKARTVPGTPWLLLGTVALSIAVSAVATAGAACPAGPCAADPAKVSLSGIDLGRVLIVVFAVVTIGAEYSTGTIAVSLAALPRRATLLAGKAIVVTGLVSAAGTVAVLGSLTVGRFILPAQALSLVDGRTLSAALGTVLYLALLALLSLGTATAVRNSATAIGIVLALLYLFPIVAAVSDTGWSRRLQQIAPMTAGLASQATTGAPQPIGAWAGLGVLTAWTAAALAAGLLALRRRDA